MALHFGLRFWEPADWPGRLIAAISQDISEHPVLAPGEHPCCHVSMEIWGHEGPPIGIEAVPMHVRRYNPRAIHQPTRLYAYPATGAAARRFWLIAKTHVGERYDLIPGYLLVMWYGLTRRPTRILDNRSASVFCSEFATHILREGGLEPFRDHRPADNATPVALEAAAQSLKWERV